MIMKGTEGESSNKETVKGTSAESSNKETAKGREGESSNAAENEALERKQARLQDVRERLARWRAYIDYSCTFCNG